MSFPSTAKGVSRDGVHVILWGRSANGRLRLQVGTFAEELAISQEAMSRMITQMAAEGRITVVSRRARTAGVFMVVDPKAWFARHGETG